MCHYHRSATAAAEAVAVEQHSDTWAGYLITVIIIDCVHTMSSRVCSPSFSTLNIRRVNLGGLAIGGWRLLIKSGSTCSEECVYHMCF